jgi:2-desacetyl-2-hydroxyethyl bacteriochlorophyllide A dehydrogenase
MAGHVGLATPPLILGHEIAGEIVAVGPGVTRVRAGYRVTVDQVIGCGECFFCRRGSVQYCETGYELGITRDGGCQEFLLVPETNVYELPDSISFEEGAILDMEVWAALAKCGIRTGDSVLVLGHGPAGMVACQIARAMGARRIMLAGRSQARMQKAEALGLADRYFAAQDDLVEIVKSETSGHGADVVFECAGSPETAAAALDAAIPGGKVVFYGLQKNAIDHFALNRIVLKDLVVFGALSDRRGWEQVISLVKNGDLRLAPLITHRFSLDCAPAAYELVRSKADGVVKAVLMH